jgi:hypothetical protein
MFGGFVDLVPAGGGGGYDIGLVHGIFECLGMAYVLTFEIFMELNMIAVFSRF